jgi:hypothetical protein
MKTEIDSRAIHCIEYLVKNKGYKSEREFLQSLGFPEAKLSEARKGKSGFRADDIGKILMTFGEINGHWIMTGKGDMLLQPDNNISNSSFILQEYNQLKAENRELIEEIGKLKERIEQMKKR